MEENNTLLPFQITKGRNVRSYLNIPSWTWHHFLHFLSHSSQNSCWSSFLPMRCYLISYLSSSHTIVSLSLPLNPALLPLLPSASPKLSHLPEGPSFLSPTEGNLAGPTSTVTWPHSVDSKMVWGPDGLHYVAYMVVTPESVLEANSFPQGTTYLSKDGTSCSGHGLNAGWSKWVNIYTDSKYAFLIAHSQSGIWKERGFFTTKGTPITNAPIIKKLLQTFLPCSGGHHTLQKTLIFLGLSGQGQQQN